MSFPLDPSGQPLTAGILARIRGDEREYIEPPAPNSQDPDEIIRAMRERVPESTIRDYTPQSTPAVRVKPKRPELTAASPEPPEPPMITSRHQEMIDLVRCGLSQSEIAEATGMTVGGVCSALRRYGLSARPVKRGAKPGGPHDATIRRMVLRGAKLRCIMDETGMSGGGVSGAMKRLGLRAAWRRIKGLQESPRS